MKESFRAQEQSSSHEKFIVRSGVLFLFLFVLTDAILLNLDLQKRTMWEVFSFLSPLLAV